MTATETGIAQARLLRCPVCLNLHALPAAISADEYVNCSKCKRPFKVCYGLPAREDPHASHGNDPPASAPLPTGSMGAPNWIILFLALIPMTYFGSYIVRDFYGPVFLVYYGAIFLAALILATIVRHAWRDEMIISVYACLLYEGIGITRVFTSAHPGPRRYEFLILMMFFGGFIFFARAKSFENMGSGDGGSSCGSSCGGGGCGGGGCGGGGCGG